MRRHPKPSTDATPSDISPTTQSDLDHVNGSTEHTILCYTPLQIIRKCLGLRRPPKKCVTAERIWDPEIGQWINLHASTPAQNRNSHPQPIIRNGIYHTFNIRARVPTPPSQASSSTNTPRPVQPALDTFETADLYREPSPPPIYDQARDQLGDAPTADQAEGDDPPNIEDLRLAEVLRNHHCL